MMSGFQHQKKQITNNKSKSQINQNGGAYSKYSESKDIYLTIESSPPPLPNERTPLLGRRTVIFEQKLPSFPKIFMKKSKTTMITTTTSTSISSDSDNTTTTTTTNNSNTNQQQKDKQSANDMMKFYDLRLLGIGIILIGGFSIALYLLILDNNNSYFPVASFTLDLVNREIWSKTSQLILPPPPLRNNFITMNNSNNNNMLHVLMLHTGGEECYELENCINLLQQMDEKYKFNYHTELPYNFVIGGDTDGQIYEIRGWHYQHGYQMFLQQQYSASLVIGFIGNFTVKPPSEIQLKSALSLINEGQQKYKTTTGKASTFQIYGLRNLTQSIHDGDALFHYISKWNQFQKLLQIQ